MNAPLRVLLYSEGATNLDTATAYLPMSAAALQATSVFDTVQSKNACSVDPPFLVSWGVSAIQKSSPPCASLDSHGIELMPWESRLAS